MPTRGVLARARVSADFHVERDLRSVATMARACSLQVPCSARPIAALGSKAFGRGLDKVVMIRVLLCWLIRHFIGAQNHILARLFKGLLFGPFRFNCYPQTMKRREFFMRARRDSSGAELLDDGVPEYVGKAVHSAILFAIVWG